MNDFEGKHVVVSGGTGGLGVFVVTALLDRGATCHIPMFEPAIPATLPWASHARVVATPKLTLDDDAAVTAYYAQLPSLWASIHLVGGFSMSSIVDTTRADLDKMLTLNVVTCFLGCREAVRTIRRTSSASGGRIVNVSAKPALTPTAGMVAYAASKSAIASITQSLSAEVASEGIFVNAVVPSIIDTPANRAAMPDADFAKWPKPTELAETIAFLASPTNVLTSGALVPVYGRS
jgi:NAD(P)-dependent dehydrogenase (short-subunit alcohol dehydrogenase family)